MVPQPGQFEHEIDLLPDRVALNFSEREPKGNVLFDSHMLEKRLLLRHDTQPSRLRGNVRRQPPVQENLTCTGGVETSNQPEERRLAATGRPKYNDHLACRNIEVYTVENGLTSKPLPNASHTDCRRARHCAELRVIVRCDLVNEMVVAHRLTRPAALIVVGDVIRALDGRLAPMGCVSSFDYDPCEFEHGCGLKVLWSRTRAAILGVLDQSTIADLCTSPASNPGDRVVRISHR